MGKKYPYAFQHLHVEYDVWDWLNHPKLPDAGCTNLYRSVTKSICAVDLVEALNQPEST